MLPMSESFLFNNVSCIWTEKQNIPTVPIGLSSYIILLPVAMSMPTSCDPCCGGATRSSGAVACKGFGRCLPRPQTTNRWCVHVFFMFPSGASVSIILIDTSSTVFLCSWFNFRAWCRLLSSFIFNAKKTMVTFQFRPCAERSSKELSAAWSWEPEGFGGTHGYHRFGSFHSASVFVRWSSFGRSMIFHLGSTISAFHCSPLCAPQRKRWNDRCNSTIVETTSALGLPTLWGDSKQPRLGSAEMKLHKQVKLPETDTTRVTLSPFFDSSWWKCIDCGKDQLSHFSSRSQSRVFGQSGHA